MMRLGQAGNAKGLTDLPAIRGPLSSSFVWLIYLDPQKELLRGLWVLM